MFAVLFDDKKGKGPVEFEIGPNGMGLDLLRAVYRNSSVELSTRMKAAALCLPYEAPKLAVTALISESDFASVLDRRLRHLEEMKNEN